MSVTLETLQHLEDTQLRQLQRLLQPKLTKYIPHEPSLKQKAFLLLDCEEALFGGAAGGGKSDALLMAALQYVDVPGYNSLLLRRTFQDLSKPEALMDRAFTWLKGTDARWIERDKQWRFPTSGPDATLTFGYLQYENDKYQYQSAAFQFIGFDELTQFSESQYRYMFSRMRKMLGFPVPRRMRSASNPGGLGHEWVKQRFLVEGVKKGRIFVPATLKDNVYIDQEDYKQSLANLDPVTLEQLLNGDWTARSSGSIFRREWFHLVDQAPVEMDMKVRYWDLAATEHPDSCYTVGLLLGVSNGSYYVLDVRRTRTTPRGVERLVRQTAELDGKSTYIYIEQEPGSSGVNTIDHYQREVLWGWICQPLKASTNKVARAMPVASATEAGNVHVLKRAWTGAFLDEVDGFPEGQFMDQVDGLTGAYHVVSTFVKPRIRRLR